VGEKFNKQTVMQPTTQTEIRCGFDVMRGKKRTGGGRERRKRAKGRKRRGGRRGELAGVAVTKAWLGYVITLCCIGAYSCFVLLIVVEE
jgi:hypothetical protein